MGLLPNTARPDGSAINNSVSNSDTAATFDRKAHNDMSEDDAHSPNTTQTSYTTNNSRHTPYTVPHDAHSQNSPTPNTPNDHKRPSAADTCDYAAYTPNNQRCYYTSDHYYPSPYTTKYTSYGHATLDTYNPNEYHTYRCHYCDHHSLSSHEHYTHDTTPSHYTSLNYYKDTVVHNEPYSRDNSACRPSASG